jgi:hypothetical protein
VRNGAVPFQRRAALYSYYDELLCPYTRFFAAAAAINGTFARLISVFPSIRSLPFLSEVGAALEIDNLGFARAVQGRTPGRALDYALVRAEQAKLQRHIHERQAHCPQQWRSIHRELNSLLNHRFAAAFLCRWNEGSGGLFRVLKEVRGHVGGEIDFAVESHRVRIGQGLIEHIQLNDSPSDAVDYLKFPVKRMP